MGGLTIPNLSPRPDPWAQFMQAFMYGQQLRQERERYDQQFQSEAEDRKIRQQGLKLQLDQLKLEGAHRDRQFEQEKAKGLFDMIGMSSGPQSPVQIESPTGGTIEGPMGMPDLSVPMEVPGFGTLNAPTMQGRQQMDLSQILQKVLMEAQGAGMKEEAVQGVRAPYEAAARSDTQGFELEKQARGLEGQKELAGADRAFQARQKELDRRVTLEATRYERDNKGLAAEGASRLAVVKTLDGTAEKLKEKLKGASRVKLFQISAGLDPSTSRLLEDVVDTDIRIRTGAAATRDEIQARKEQIIRMMDATTGNTAPALEAIERMQEEARNVAQGIDPGGRFGRLALPGGASPNAPAFVKYQGKTVPFAQLPPEIQQQVLALAGR